MNVVPNFKSVCFFPKIFCDCDSALSGESDNDIYIIYIVVWVLSGEAVTVYYSITVSYNIYHGHGNNDYFVFFYTTTGFFFTICLLHDVYLP